MPAEVPADGSKAPPSKQYRVDRADRKASFVLYFVDLPPSTLDQKKFEEFYYKQRDEIIERNAGKIRLETNLSLTGHPGREFQVATAQGATVIQRMYIVEDANCIRLYMLQATVIGHHGPGMAARYMDSLKLPPRNEQRRG
jgi:hypothetical protein